jgi:hypothetical protein
MTKIQPLGGPSNQDRVISMGPGLASLPEKLLLAHARGEVLFIAGAGISQPAGLPDFRGLVVKIYEKLDTAVHAVISKIPSPPNACFHWSTETSMGTLLPYCFNGGKRQWGRCCLIALMEGRIVHL